MEAIKISEDSPFRRLNLPKVEEESSESSESESESSELNGIIGSVNESLSDLFYHLEMNFDNVKIKN